MAKKGMDGLATRSLLYDAASTSGWVLCIGAGTSQPVFPSWAQVVEDLVAEDKSVHDAPGTARELLSRYSPDALVQAARDRLKLGDSEFAELLAEVLYRRFRSMLSTSEWKVVARVLNARGPAQGHSRTWADFHQIHETYLSGLTASVLAKFVAALIGSSYAPSAILSFNAEPLLYALINYKLRTASDLGRTSGQYVRGELAQPLDLVTRSIADRRPGRIPYIFCHGLLPIPGLPPNVKSLESLDKIVFSESDYLQLANSSFSWQSSSFLDLSSSRRVLFVGVSLSDANMRRWLSWVHSNRNTELSRLKSYSGASTPHLWLTTRSGNAAEDGWMESAVSHLGVRIIWLNAWREVSAVLRRLLGSASRGV
jgi:hypothetical protein